MSEEKMSNIKMFKGKMSKGKLSEGKSPKEKWVYGNRGTKVPIKVPKVL